MSTSADSILAEVYRILQDTVEGRHVVKEDAIQQAYNRQVSLVASDLGLAPAWDVDAISVVAGTSDYSLPSSVEYGSVLRLRYVSDLRQLRRVSMERILTLRDGGLPAGRAYEYCLVPKDDGGVAVWLSTEPSDDETIEALVSSVPSAWSPDDATAPTVPFSRGAVRALELLIAAAVGVTLDEERMVALSLNPASFADWRTEAMRLIAQEKLKLIRLKRAGGATVLADWEDS